MIFTLLPDPDGDIRTDLPADGAAGAGPLIVPANIEVSLPVDFLPGPDQSFRAGNRTKPTSFATLTVDFDLSHSQRQKSPSKNPSFQILQSSRLELQNRSLLSVPVSSFWNFDLILNFEV